jgi:hypothetical protein
LKSSRQVGRFGPREARTGGGTPIHSNRRLL